MQLFRKSLLLLMPALLCLTACNREDEVEPTEENETITTAVLELTNRANANEKVTATIDNLNTTANTSQATLRLRPNTTYTGRVLLSDKTQTPTLDVSAYIKEEANEHLFVYTPSTGLNLTVTITDRDTSPAPGPFPLGLETEMRTGAASTGRLNVRLRHQPDAKNGRPEPGSDDLNVNFDVVIQ